MFYVSSLLISLPTIYWNGNGNGKRKENKHNFRKYAYIVISHVLYLFFEMKIYTGSLSISKNIKSMKLHENRHTTKICALKNHKSSM